MLSGTWFEGLGKADLAMLADSRLSQNETWKKMYERTHSILKTKGIELLGGGRVRPGNWGHFGSSCWAQ